jgi:glutaconate CoA-transferase subunit B
MVITDRALFNFDKKSKEMTLIELAPGESVESIKDEIGWDLKVADKVTLTKPPTSAELSLIREELDPQGIYR